MKISPKQAATYLDCPKRYRFEYVTRPRPHRTGGPWAHITLGNVVHETLAEWTTLDPAERTPGRARRLLAARWRDEGFRDNEQAGLWFTHACDWIEGYCAQPEAQSAVVRGSERTVSAKYGNLVVEGRVDRIDQRGDRLVVVDYKTGRTAPTDAEAGGSYALAVYAYATTRIFGRAYGWCTRAELHHLPTRSVVAVDYDRDRIYRLLDRLVEISREIETARATHDEAAALPPGQAQEVQAAAFPARPGGLCASCDFLTYCTEGQARTTRAEPWAYLRGDATATPATV